MWKTLSSPVEDLLAISLDREILLSLNVLTFKNKVAVMQRLYCDNYYHLQKKFREGNAFTPVCHLVQGGESVSQHAMGQERGVHPWTPPRDRHPPRGKTPPWTHR